ncbi:MAG: PrgI family protein [bacterium]|nr:PrgI family protein [bacterium]
MRYQVPQFIEVEDKIFGPLTFKQFIYLAGGGGLCLLFFTLLPIYLTVLFGIPVMAFALALAFYKVNGRPFIVSVEHAFGYFFGHKLYLWKQRQQVQQTTSTTPVAPAILTVPKLSESKLKDLAWSLNIKDRNQMGVADTTRGGFEI